MRVLFLASYFPRPSKPLIGTWALQQAKALARISDLHVVCSTSYIPSPLAVIPRAAPWVNVPPTHQWDNVTAHYLKIPYYPVPPFKHWAYPNPERQMKLAWKFLRRRLLDLTEKFSPDIIYAHHTAVNGYFAEQVHRCNRIPYVITDHDFGEIADCEKFRRRRAMFQRIIDSAARNVCVAKRMHADMHRIFPSARAVTIYNGINPHPPHVFTTPRPTELQDKTIILSAGMFAARKGFPLLIEAFAKIADKHPNALLRIAGGGEQQILIEQTIARFQLQSRVQLLGLLPQEKLFQEMVWSDAFALISWDEPFATVFLEAMGAGKPVLTASDGGINDVVQHGVHGLVVPPHNLDAAAQALDDLLTDPKGRETMGSNAKSLVDQHLTWDANARQLLEIFDQAISAQVDR